MVTGSGIIGHAERIVVGLFLEVCVGSMRVARPRGYASVFLIIAIECPLQLDIRVPANFYCFGLSGIAFFFKGSSNLSSTFLSLSILRKILSDWVGESVCLGS
jgi:hypothetical protein